MRFVNPKIKNIAMAAYTCDATIVVFSGKRTPFNFRINKPLE